MILNETQAQLLKDWLIKKLENDSDADSDVLADYVLALVRVDGQPEDLRASIVDNLRDFLQDGTELFVDQVLTTIKTGAYDPNARSQPPAQSLAPSGPRKRTFDDRGDDTAQYSRYGQGDRSIKQMRRGGRGGRHTQNGQPAQAMNMPFPPDMDMQQALQTMMAMQQAMGLPLPGMDAGMDFQSSEYTYRGGRGRGRGAFGQTRGGRRADFSSAAPNNDRSITSIVVEKIPEDKMEDQPIRDFFDQFGTIQHIDLQTRSKLAIIRFSTWDEANAAYSSPKVIFDNRFVKVFWHKPQQQQQTHRDSSHFKDTDMTATEPEVSHEEIAKRQEEAQRKHEEAKKARDEAAKQKLDVESKLKAMEAERAKMAALLARKAAKADANGTTTDGDASAAESEQTKGLKAQLAKLEAEAKSLGIDPATDDPATNAWSPSTPWRGRAGFRGRGRGIARGGWPTAARGGAVKRLDNRPRTVAVIFAQGTFDQFDEAMRQYLLFTNQLEQATLSKHPERNDAAMLVFDERYRAENFMALAKGPKGIPNIGTVETAWMQNPVTTPATPAEPVKQLATVPVVQTDAKMTDADVPPQASTGDLDVDEGNPWD